MKNYNQMAGRQRKWLLYILLIVAILTFFVEDRHFFLGLLIGTAVSFYNLWLLQRRTNLLGESAERSGKRTGLGTVSRLSMAALGTLITIHYDASIIAFVIGLMLVYPVIIVDFLLFNRK